MALQKQPTSDKVYTVDRQGCVPDVVWLERLPQARASGSAKESRPVRGKPATGEATLLS